MEKNKELRYVSELRAVGENRHIVGYGAVWNQNSLDFGGWHETIMPEAAEGVIERSDVLALLNHDERRGVLARSTNGEGSMKLTIDEHGLKYEFDAPHTALGDELLEGVKRGDIRASSFAFTVEEDSWDKEEDGRYLRTIRKFGELFDVSPVYNPAYPQTEVATRSFENVKKLDLDAYYSNLKKELYVGTERKEDESC